jgi:cytochrome c5
MIAALAASPVAARAADESGLRLAEGPGRDRVQAACSMCHSLDYILMNSPFQDAASWRKTVDKMVKVYGAPLSPEEAALIVAYLGDRYSP